MSSYKFKNAKSSMSGVQHDEIVVEIDDELVPILHAEAQVIGTAYSHSEADNPQYLVKRVNGAHTDSMIEQPYSEIHVRANGRVTVAVYPLEYTVALERDAYEDFGLDSHDHMDW